MIDSSRKRICRLNFEFHVVKGHNNILSFNWCNLLCYFQCRTLLNLLGVPCIESAGEAEALCAWLDLHQVEWSILTFKDQSWMTGNINRGNIAASKQCMAEISALPFFIPFWQKRYPSYIFTWKRVSPFTAFHNRPVSWINPPKNNSSSPFHVVLWRKCFLLF